MEVVVPSPSPPGSPSMDPFDFHGARISPYLSAPPSPKRFGEYYTSAPTSPSRLTDFYSDFDHYLAASPSNPGARTHDDGGFAFAVGGETEKPSRSAEELFDGGKIKRMTEDDLLDSSRSPLLSPGRQQPRRSTLAQGKKAIRDALSPRRNKDSENDHFAPGRGRDRTPAASAGSTSRRVTRSHSPYRVSYSWEEEQNVQQRAQSQNQSQNKKEDPMRGSLSSKSSSRKWRLRDFLLFRSASEGRGTSKDPFSKYPTSFRKTDEAAKASFRSSDNLPKSRRKEAVSAHELHYARKKAESEDLKKRTFLPYKQGILGRLAGFAL